MELSLTLQQPHRRGELFGPGDRFLRRIREATGVRIHARSNTVRLTGEPVNVARAAAVLERLQEALRDSAGLDDDHVIDAIAETVPTDDRGILQPAGGLEPADGEDESSPSQPADDHGRGRAPGDGHGDRGPHERASQGRFREAAPGARSAGTPEPDNRGGASRQPGRHVPAAAPGTAEHPAYAGTDIITVFTRGAEVIPKTDGQLEYMRALRRSDMVFCLGPAGTGKTYMAVAMAVHKLKTGKTKRIALVRPAVEAGERLGFLPGDIQQKVNPYLRPIFDALLDMMTYDQMKRFMMADIIEVMPLAYMRGRTLNHSSIILDEAQNTTPSQMLMFLTRLGNDSQMIITGDDSQTDLEPGQLSGLVDAVDRLRDTPGIDIVRLSQVDIVRHPLVQEVITRYADAPQHSVPPRRRR